MEKRVGAEVQEVQVQVVRVSCRWLQAQVAAVRVDGRQDRLAGRQTGRQTGRWYAFQDGNACSLRNRKWTRGKKRSVIVQDKRED